MPVTVNWNIPTWLSGTFKAKGEAEKAPDKFVLVPPLFERGNRDRDRFLHSSYEYAFAKRQLQRLMQDYQDAQYQGVLLLSPYVERRLSVEARIAPNDASMTLRFQPQEFDPSTFVNVTVTPQAAEKALLGCSLFHPQLGVGAFATAPLAKKLSGTNAKVGLRYSSPYFSTGVAMEPAHSAPSSFWAVGRYAGAVAGLQLRLDGLAGGSPPAAVAGSGGGLDLEALRSRLCYTVAYEPTFTHAKGSGQFTASIEMREGRNLIVSFFQHMAQVRRHVNPLEDKHVVGITNYIDLGIQVNLDLTGPPPAAAKVEGSPVAQGQAQVQGGSLLKEDVNIGTINAAAAWQINKNWLLKCRVGDQSASAGVAVKTWGQTGLVAAANVTCRYDDPRRPRYGATLQLENFGERRYERGVSVASGRAVLQRHEANEQDVANVEGTGKVVIREALESEYNPPVTDATADYL